MLAGEPASKAPGEEVVGSEASLLTQSFAIYLSPFRLLPLETLSAPLFESNVTSLSAEKLTKGVFLIAVAQKRP